MSVPQYTAGAWTAVVRPGFVALVGPDADAALARALWDAAPEGVVAVLDVLARDGLAALPHFAVAAVDGTRVHVALRGDVDVEVTETDGAQQVLRAGGVRTWSEQVLETVGVLVARVGAATGDAVPLVDGVAPAGSVRVEVAEVVVAEPEPQVEPEPAAEVAEPDSPPATPDPVQEAPASAAPATTKRGGSTRVAAAPAQPEPAPVEESTSTEPVAETAAETPAAQEGARTTAQETPARKTPVPPAAQGATAVDEPRAEVADVATPEAPGAAAAPVAPTAPDEP
ncbi:hypothetical protein HLB10_14160, partial [Cellulomonas fimi]|nr:hypothetical protein [Cellulomonas fimi]